MVSKGSRSEQSEGPATKAIAAWISSAGPAAGARPPACRGRPAGHGPAAGAAGPAGALLPVFADHDRSLHAERQGLLALLAAARGAGGGGRAPRPRRAAPRAAACARGAQRRQV